jgi:hypothetical protein
MSNKRRIMRRKKTTPACVWLDLGKIEKKDLEH